MLVDMGVDFLLPPDMELRSHVVPKLFISSSLRDDSRKVHIARLEREVASSLDLVARHHRKDLLRDGRRPIFAKGDFDGGGDAGLEPLG